MKRTLFLVLFFFLLFGFGCAGIKGDLEYARSNYESAHYEKALVWLKELESKMGEMDGPTRAEYLYLRGMTEYHFEKYQLALHYLSLTQATVQNQMSGQEPKWYPVLVRTLALITPSEKTHFAQRPQMQAGAESKNTAQSVDPAASPNQTSADDGKKDGDPFVR